MRATIFSPCRQYRYTLWREWDMFNPTYLQVIGLNPSTADETHDDPTIRCCITLAKSWGYGGLCMTNLFAYRSTDPRYLRQCAMPIGLDNDAWIDQVAGMASLVLAAWGTGGGYLNRDRDVLRRMGWPLVCLGVTKDGYPRHPLYVRRDQQPIPYVHTILDREAGG